MLKKLGASGLVLAFAVLLVPAVALAAHDFKLTNKGTHQIDHVYLSKPNEDSWGDDQLDNDEVIAPGRKVTWSINDGCIQDVKIVYHDKHKEIEEKFDTCKYDLEMTY
ncbi:MAG: hypothetical protein GIW95_10865 [Candidatus Eremiobacteraeota bacterium]|nr:hypothetical protein [Candidatus Eremiobacteraeota bacterium]